MKKLTLILFASILFLSCDRYEPQGLLHPTQLDSVIIVQQNSWDSQIEVIRYYDLKDRKFKKCDFNAIYKEYYQLGDTIIQK
jgi:hypothetical protein